MGLKADESTDVTQLVGLKVSIKCVVYSARFPLYEREIDHQRLREQQVRRLMADTLSARLVADTYTLLVDNKLIFFIFIFKR